MSNGFNKAILIGNLGNDPELRYTQAGRALLKLRLATNESWRDADGNEQGRTDWHDLVVWGRRAEALHKFLSKGRRVGVEGRIRTHRYEDKDGKTRTKVDIEVVELVLLDRARDGAPARAPVEEPPYGPEPGAAAGDDIPF